MLLSHDGPPEVVARHKRAQESHDAEFRRRAELYKTTFLADRNATGAQQHLLPGSGLRYYIACSGLVGVPFRPSSLRALILRSGMEADIRRWRASVATEVPMGILEEQRTGVLRQEVARLFEVNVANAHAPAVLSYLLSVATTPQEVLDLALQLRESPEAVEYRKWSNELSAVIQNGSIRDVARYLREVEKMTGKINRRFKLSPGEKSAELALGWGPLEVKKAIAAPAVFSTPVRVKRHLWILYNLYKFALSSPSWGAAAERVLLSRLPEPLTRSLGGLDWNEFQGPPRRVL